MKNFFSIILMFSGAINLYCFDLIEDTFEFLFDDLAKVIGIVVIIAAIIFFVRKYLNKDKNSDKGNWYYILAFRFYFLRKIKLKKIILNSLILIFIASVRLYCFDDIFEDIFDDFEDFFRIVGIIAMIIIVMYFVKRFIKDDYNLKNNDNKKNGNIPKIKYDKKENKEYKIIEYDYDKENIKEDKYDK